MVRADAARNRAAILRSARSLIAAHGPEAGMDEIAARAGVAVGTLYRHFPTKTDLVNAVLDELAQEIAADLDAAVSRTGEGSNAAQELATLFHRIAVDKAADRALRDAATKLGIVTIGDIERRAVAALARLISAGHAQGTIRSDVNGDDVVLLLQTLPVDSVPEPARRRWVQLAIRSLTT